MFTTFHINRSIITPLTVACISSAFSQETKTFDRIFGGGPNYNGMALVIDENYTFKHDTTTCSIQRINQKGKAVWTTDLRAYGCSLIYLGKLSVGEIKGCDVVIQFDDKRICGIRKNNGRLLLLTEVEIERARKRQESRMKK